MAAEQTLAVQNSKSEDEKVSFRQNGSFRAQHIQFGKATNNDGPETSSDEGEVKCPCANHEGKEILNVRLPLSVDYVFSLIFADSSKFFNDLHVARKTTDLVRSNWEDDDETGDKTRQMTYTVVLNSAVAKTAVSKESQRMLSCSSPGSMYIVDSVIVNQGVPYSDSFCIKSRTCLTRVSKLCCHMQIYSTIAYTKSVWGLVKTIIEKTAMQGVIEFSSDLEMALKQECSPGTSNVQEAPPQLATSNGNGSTAHLNIKADIPKKVRIAEAENKVSLRESSYRPLSSISVPSVIETPAPPSGSIFPTVPTESFIHIGIAVLVVLLVINFLLFIKMSSIEDFSLKLSVTPEQGQGIPYDRLPHLSQKDFIRLLTQQEELHRAEINNWVEILNELVKLFTMTQKSLSDLQKGVESYKTSKLLGKT